MSVDKRTLAQFFRDRRREIEDDGLLTEPERNEQISIVDTIEHLANEGETAGSDLSAAQKKIAELEAERDEAKAEARSLRPPRTGLNAFAREANSMCEHGIQPRVDLICRYCAEQALTVERQRREAEWRPIETLFEAEDDTLILACVESDGRMMPWRASMLKRQLREGSPRHLMFPATHWRDMPLLPNGQPAPLLPPMSGGAHG